MQSQTTRRSAIVLLFAVCSIVAHAEETAPQLESPETPERTRRCVNGVCEFAEPVRSRTRVLEHGVFRGVRSTQEGGRTLRNSPDAFERARDSAACMSIASARFRGTLEIPRRACARFRGTPGRANERASDGRRAIDRVRDRIRGRRITRAGRRERTGCTQ